MQAAYQVNPRFSHRGVGIELHDQRREGEQRTNAPALRPELARVGLFVNIVLASVKFADNRAEIAIGACTTASSTDHIGMRRLADWKSKPDHAG